MSYPGQNPLWVVHYKYQAATGGSFQYTTRAKSAEHAKQIFLARYDDASIILLGVTKHRSKPLQSPAK